jgi:hypothetical protein
MPGQPIKPTTTRDSFSVESLSVTGNQATVWARAKSDQTLHEFLFIDNGSAEPDAFAWDGALIGPDPVVLASGDVTVIP